MAVKLRLARHGRKSNPFYYIVAADSRTPRDGKFIERIGSYNPKTNPATIELNFEKALSWVMNGAQPTDTVSRILSYKGILMKKHLLEGVRKGAFDEAEANKRFVAWEADKLAKISSKVNGLDQAKRNEESAKFEAEKLFNAQRAEAIAKKYAAAAKAAAKVDEVEETEEVVEVAETVAEAVVEVVETETAIENTEDSTKE